MRILIEPIKIDELLHVAKESFGDMVKAVVDVEREIVAIDAELHSDLETLCLEDGSKQQSLWGINYYPEMEGEDFIEFDSMINLRPSQGNFSRGITDETICNIIRDISTKWIRRT